MRSTATEVARTIVEDDVQLRNPLHVLLPEGAVGLRRTACTSAIGCPPLELSAKPRIGRSTQRASHKHPLVASADSTAQERFVRARARVLCREEIQGRAG